MNPPCLACGAPGMVFRAGRNLYICTKCGTARRARLDEADEYAAGYEAAREHDRDDVFALKQGDARAHLAPFAARGGHIRYLEVGCSTGPGLAAAAALGFAVTGVEANPAAAAVAAARVPGAAVHAGGFETMHLGEARFDLVALFDVIEHFPDPAQATDRLARLLVPGGTLLLVTPDFGSLSARLMGSRWPHELPEHPWMFTRRGLAAMAARAGLVPASMRRAGKRVHFDVLAAHARLHPHVLGAGVLRLLAALLPRGLRRLPLPFNVGEVAAHFVRPAERGGAG